MKLENFYRNIVNCFIFSVNFLHNRRKFFHNYVTFFKKYCKNFQKNERKIIFFRKFFQKNVKKSRVFSYP